MSRRNDAEGSNDAVTPSQLHGKHNYDGDGGGPLPQPNEPHKVTEPQPLRPSPDRLTGLYSESGSGLAKYTIFQHHFPPAYLFFYAFCCLPLIQHPINTSD